MINQSYARSQAHKGVSIWAGGGAARRKLSEMFESFGLQAMTSFRETEGAVQVALSDAVAERLAPGANTLHLAEQLAATLNRTERSAEREILAAMLASPFELAFPSFEEFESAIRIRRNIVEAAARTQLAFDTRAIERPEDCWQYSDESGFTIVPGYSIIDALIKATQPDASGRRYAFSCYRASEYVILLGIAQELAAVNPDLLARLQARWERKSIMSGAFHEAFLVERGSIEQPVPARYYVPGDRVWFRNPDTVSSDVGGYEGSWVIYLGRGLFSNFWSADTPFTLERKCLEIFHWRNGVNLDSTGESRMDESVVEQRVCQTLADPDETKTIVERMMRFRDPMGVYASGGCIDASREHPRFVHPITSDIRLDV